MNEKLQLRGVQLPLPDQRVSNDIILQAGGHYWTELFLAPEEKVVGGVDHLVPACDMRTSHSRQRAWNVLNLQGTTYLGVSFCATIEFYYSSD